MESNVCLLERSCCEKYVALMNNDFIWKNVVETMIGLAVIWNMTKCRWWPEVPQEYRLFRRRGPIPSAQVSTTAQETVVRPIRRVHMIGLGFSEQREACRDIETGHIVQNFHRGARSGGNAPPCLSRKSLAARARLGQYNLKPKQ